MAFTRTVSAQTIDFISLHFETTDSHYRGGCGGIAADHHEQSVQSLSGGCGGGQARRRHFVSDNGLSLPQLF